MGAVHTLDGDRVEWVELLAPESPVAPADPFENARRASVASPHTGPGGPSLAPRRAYQKLSVQLVSVPATATVLQMAAAVQETKDDRSTAAALLIAFRQAFGVADLTLVAAAAREEEETAALLTELCQFCAALDSEERRQRQAQGATAGDRGGITAFAHGCADDAARTGGNGNAAASQGEGRGRPGLLFENAAGTLAVLRVGDEEVLRVVPSSLRGSKGARATTAAGAVAVTASPKPTPADTGLTLLVFLDFLSADSCVQWGGSSSSSSGGGARHSCLATKLMTLTPGVANDAGPREDRVAAAVPRFALRLAEMYGAQWVILASVHDIDRRDLARYPARTSWNLTSSETEEGRGLASRQPTLDWVQLPHPRLGRPSVLELVPSLQHLACA